MTTITIDRELLEQAMDALDEATTYTGSQTWSPSFTQEILDLCVKLRAALAAPATAPEPLKARPDFIAGYDAGMADAKRMQMAAALEYQRQLVDVQVRSAPATAPEQPSWQDAPTVPGLWVCRQAITDNVQAYEVTDQMALNRNLKLKGQWYGPIPEDKQ